MTPPSLADLTAFAAVARHRSFRAAADELGVARSTLSHAVRALETRLGARLLNRTTRSVAPTAAGARLLARLAPALGELDAALAEVGDEAGGAVGTVRINALRTAAAWLVRYVVPAFMARHPRVAVDIVVDDRLVDIVAAGFDAGVRLREAVPQDMIAVPFGGDVRFVAVASPGYIAAHGEPATPDDLARHRCIRQRLAGGRPYRWEFARGRHEIAVDVPGMLTLNDNAVMAEAAADGLGIAFVPERAAAAAIAEGRLRVVLDDWSPAIAGLCLYYPGRRHVPPALRAFGDAVRAAAEG